jgi:myo-inositol-1(or 4)-monophosphatase
MHASSAAGDADWLAVCRRAADGARAALERFPTTAERAESTGRGEGGDRTLVIDRAAEDAILEELAATGLPLTVISEERGRVELAGGGPAHVIVDPIDGSLNAKRALPGHCVSIAVAEGAAMGDVFFGYVRELAAAGTEWCAHRGGGAFRDGEPLSELDAQAELEILAVEGADPELVAGAAGALAAVGAKRLRIPGAVATSMCHVAAANADAMLCLAPARSVDFAAGQLIVREAGGSVAFPDVDGDLRSASLGLDMRSRVAAAAHADMLEALLASVSAEA